MLQRVALAVLLSGCLPHLDGDLPDAATPDASGGALFAVTGIQLHTLDGQPREAESAPSWPRIDVTTSAQPDDVDVVFLLPFAPNESLLEDAATRPLRASNLSAAVPLTIAPFEGGWRILPRTRLESGRHALLVAGWARGGGEAIAAPVMAELTVASGPDAGTRFAGSWPPDGAGAVGPQLSRLAVRFDGPFESPPNGIALREGDVELPAALAPRPCSELGWSSGECAELLVGVPLVAASTYELSVAESVLDATGAPIGPAVARFTTAAAPDGDPPSLLAPPCALDEVISALGCVLADDGSITIRVLASEPVRVRLALGARARMEVAPRGEATLRFDGLTAETELTASLHLEDLAALPLEVEALVATTPPLATLSVVEVRSDPSGREPRQEYVEILNFGDAPVPLAGITLSDRADAEGDPIETSVALAPGQRALLVADDFDPLDADDDPAVPPGATLVRIGRSLASGGLTNAGEPLYLRDAAQHRLSAAPAIATGEGRCLVRRGLDARRGDLEDFAIEACSPGRAAP